MGIKINRRRFDDSETQGTTTLWGGKPTINGSDPTKIDIAAGEVVIVDNYTTPSNPKITPVIWDEQIAVTLTGLGIFPITFLSVGVGGTRANPNILQTPGFLSPEQRRDYAIIGIAVHLSGVVVGSTEGGANLKRDQSLKFLDFMLSIKLLNVIGNDFSSNGANLLINKSEGTSYGVGINSNNSLKNPNLITNIADTGIFFIPFYINQAPPFLPSNEIDTTKYDPNKDGTLVDLPSGRFTAHRVFYDPISNLVGVQYGQFSYDSLKKAAISFDKEDFVVSPVIQEIVSRGAIIVKSGATDLTDLNESRFVNFGFFGDKIFKKIDEFSNFAENIEVSDGMSYQRPSITYVEDSGNIFCDVEAEGGGDIIYIFQQREFTLDCTTGAGVGGRARIQLTEGASANSPEQNYVYVIRSGESAILNASTTFPTGEFGWTVIVTVPDSVTFATSVPGGESSIIGPYSTQRYSDMKSLDGRGALSQEREKLRELGVSYRDGIIPVPNITTVPSGLDIVEINVTSGTYSQLLLQIFPVLDSLVDGIYIMNHPTTPMLRVENIADIDIDANGNSLENKAFNLVFVGLGSTADGTEYSKLGILLPNGSYLYSAVQSALQDESQTAVTSVDSDYSQTAFLLARITYKFRITGPDTTWINVVDDESGGTQTFFDLRGLPLGATSGGAGAPSLTQFLDGTFRINNSIDPTKQIAFDASNITTGTARTFTAPDNSGVVATVNNLIGTANQITVTDGGDTATFSLPQDIAINSSVEFGDLTIDNLFLDENTISAIGAPLILTGDNALPVILDTNIAVDGRTILYLNDGVNDMVIRDANTTATLNIQMDVELDSGDAYYIDGNLLLQAGGLGATVLSSSLTSIGALDSGSITSGFSDIDIGTNIFTGGQINIDNLRLDGNTISSTSGDINLSPTGSVIADQITLNNPPSDVFDAVRKDYVDGLIQGVNWLESVLDFIDFTTSEPGSPSIGDRYINTVTGTSSGTAQSVTIDYIYEWNGLDWSETAPEEGYAAWVEDEDVVYLYNGTSWVKFGSTVTHNNTSGLQGGTTNQFYHLTSAQHTIAIQAASTSLSGYLTDTDWDIFNAKQDTLTNGVDTLTSGEVDQLENINSVTISNTQWGYLGASDQGSATTDTPTFAGLNVDNININDNTIIATNDSGLFLFNNANNGIFVSDAGFVGIRTTTVNGLLHLASGIANRKIILHGTAANEHQFYGFGINAGVLRYQTDHTNSDHVFYAATSSSTSDELMRITGDGKVGIGSSPQTKLDVDGAILASKGNVGLGTIEGFVVKYSDTNTVAITSGYCEANGSYYELTSDTTDDLTLLPAFDFHYIYIDDSGSTPPVPTFVDSTTEPTYSASLQGWYNGDDRCIGVVESSAGVSTINYFDTIIQGKSIFNVLGANLGLVLASDMNPTGSWQTPDDNESSVGTPVNAVAVFIQMSNSDATAIGLSAASSEMAAVNTSLAEGSFRSRNYSSSFDQGLIPLGVSRNIKIGGDDNDDNLLDTNVCGYIYER